MGQKRLTLGIPTLEGGIDFLPVLIGVFAFAQDHVRGRAHGGVAKFGDAVDRSLSLAVSQDQGDRPRSCRALFLLLWTSFIGVLIGVLPAIGGSAANMIAYDQAKKLSKRRRRSAAACPRASSLGILQQRQRRRLAGDHHGLASRAMRDRRHVGRAHHPRHPVGTRFSSCRTRNSPMESLRRT